MSAARFHNLDAMRGVCALSVVLFHCEGLFAQGVVFCHGFLAVDAFFVLSGFVIAHTYEHRLGRSMSLRNFLQARLKRLTPVYWAGTILCSAMLAAVVHYKPAGTFYDPHLVLPLSAMALLLLPQWTLGGLAYPANPVAWSLMGEMFANVVYARWLFALRTRILLFVIAAGWIACAAYGYLNPYGWVFGARASDVWMTPIRALPAFLAGIVLYRGYCAGMFARLPAVSPLIPLLAWLVLAVVPSNGPTPSYDLTVVALASPLLIALLVRAETIAPRACLWLGEISYPLYASHLALIFLARNTPLLGLDQGPDPLRATLLIAATLGLAWLIHRFVEQRAPKQVQTAAA
ncbi:MAG: acyltransferase [Alphaproteobacteria bacterium]|nr:acyltransferase [Alphaproteobacteria bacterium]MBV9694899.1 acyltransferase [Alphaproteobacteria bacterium]